MQVPRALFEMLREQEKQHHDLLQAEYRRLFEPDLELGRERLPIKWYEWEDDSFRLADELDLRGNAVHHRALV